MNDPGTDYVPPDERTDTSLQLERDLSNRTPVSMMHVGSFGTPPRAPTSPAVNPADRLRDDDQPRQSSEHNRSRNRDGRTTSGHLRVCKKCGEILTGQFVRALEGTYHLDCFRCRDCNQIVASKFFPAEDEHSEGQYPLCETDYFRRLGLLCYQCGGALRGSYITALERKYHVDHFTCSLCSTVFGAQDSYYEHDGNVYCHYHYSTQFAQRCNGCQTAILKQFVEIFRNGQNQHWHPECYMIHKFWNVRLTPREDEPPRHIEGGDDPTRREMVREDEERMEVKVYRIWSTLSTFEESSAACISDMLLHVSNGAYVDGVLVAKRFIWHVDLLFRAADRLDGLTTRLDMKGLSYSREAKLLCKKVVAFFSLLSKTQDQTARKLGVTQELLSLVTGLAHYLKLLIRICLQGALRIERERETSDGLYQLLEDLGDLEYRRAEEEGLRITDAMLKLSANDSDQCMMCRKPIEDECAKIDDKRWHTACLTCSQCGTEIGKDFPDAQFNQYDQRMYCGSCHAQDSEGNRPFERVSKLQQYVFLLQVALARLLEILKSTGALHQYTDDGNEAYFADGQRSTADRESLRGDGRSKSYYGGERDHRRESSYENTLNDVRRLRSTRLDKHLSSSFRKARTSQIMSGPNAPRPGDPGYGRHHPDGIEERGHAAADSMDKMLGHQDALTLDDIPRIVAAEQVREQRQPYKNGTSDLFRIPGGEASAGADHGRSRSMGHEGDLSLSGDPSPLRGGGAKYFSELSHLEYFIVRHLAVMTMHPMVENEFTLEELLGLIESKKPPTFWNKFGKHFQKADAKKGIKKKGVFGVPLEVVNERDGADSTDGVGPGTLRIPALIDDIVSTMRQMDLSVEGVFRKNGNIKKLSDLVEKIDRDGCEGLNLGSQTVVQVAALLKRYLRELPDPLMTQKLYRLWITAAKIPEEDRRRQCLHLACCLLPKSHRDCLEILFTFLKWSGSFHQMDDESGSKMDVKNLATVITPNVLHSNNKAMALDSEAMYAIIVVETLIGYIETMCMVPEDLVYALSDPTLFAGNGDITSKEIIKRFTDRVANGSGKPYGDTVEVVNSGSRHDNPGRPFAKKVDNDPAVWQQDERSVRPINEGPSNSGSATPQRTRGREASEPAPYTQHRDDSQGRADSQERKGWRHSGWGRQNSPAPVTG